MRYLTVNSICIGILHSISSFEKIIQISIFKKIKIMFLKHLISQKDFIDNDITNIVCTKPNKHQKCEKALCKLREKKYDIYRISPKAIVACVLSNNIDMLVTIKQLGYPLEMIIYASNYHLIKKRRLEKFVNII